MAAPNPEAHISKGALSAIFNSKDDFTAPPQPVVQCVMLKSMKPGPGQPETGSERYRMVFQDTQNFVQSMLATQANWIVQDGLLQKGCFVRLKSFQANQVKGKMILIVLDLEVLSELGICEKIGNPTPIESTAEDDTKPHPTTISSNGFYGTTEQKPVQSLPSRPLNTAHPTIHPIESISPWAGNKWTIKARCTHKGEIKHWHNKNGEGKLFSANFLDESGEIRATGFNDQCDALYDLIQEGTVYYISCPCQVKMAKKQFSNLNNDYELTFERDTLVEKAEDQEDVPQIRFNFTSIGDLQNVEKDTTIDTIGILKDVGELSQITSKTTSKPYDKRELTIVDNSGFSVRLTIWGATATTFDAPEDSVIAFKGLKVSDFGGRSLSLLSSGSMAINPDIDESHKLKGWYDAQGRTNTFSSHAGMGGASSGRKDEFKTISQVKDENLGMNEEKVDYFTLKATVVSIPRQDTVSYPSCLSEGCQKKVVEIEPGQWRCERCDKTHPRPEHRYVMGLNVEDHTGQIWLSSFDDTGRLIMGMTADQLYELRENDEKAATDAFMEAMHKTWIFRCRAKMDTYQEQQRVRYQVSSSQGINFVTESARLAETLKLYNLDD